jgi:hypothetical protein
MGDLAQFVTEIKAVPGIRNHLFDEHFLDHAGTLLETRGFDEAKLYLWDSHRSRKLEKQAIFMLSIIGEMEKLEIFRENRTLAGYLVRNIHKLVD